jgi:hypothetical protein
MQVLFWKQNTRAMLTKMVFVVEPLSPIYETKESNIARTLIAMLTESNKYATIVSGSDESVSSHREDERNPILLNEKRGDISPLFLYILRGRAKINIKILTKEFERF